MPDSNPSSHWDSLASDLGIQFPAEEPVLKQPIAVPPQAPPPKSPPRVTRPTPPPAPASNWESLASNLGLAPAPQPAAAQPASPSQAAVFEPAAAKEGRRAAPAPDTPEESPNFFDERFDFEEPFDLLESSEAATPPAAEKDEAEEKRPRKRRHRRRSGKGSDRKDSHETAPVEPVETVVVEAAPSVEDAADSNRTSAIVVTEEVVIEDDTSEPAEAEQRRPKRRRSRRGKKKEVRDETQPAAIAKPGPEETDLRSVESLDGGRRGRRAAAAEDAKDMDDGSLDEDVSSEGDRPARQGFRGIPTWDEAVGLIIAKNLEARSKRGGGGDGSRQQGRGSARGTHEKRGGRGGRGGKRRS
jgi:ribonuclease E